jgi:hypothetical protein
LGNINTTLSGDGGGTASFSGRLVWRGGSIEFFGPGKLTNTGPVDFVAGTDKLLFDVDKLSLNGASSWTANNILVTNSSIENTGTFTISGGNRMNKTGGVGEFTNKAGGTVTKTGGGTTTFRIPFTTSGNLLLNSFRIAFERGLLQDGNGLTDLGLNGQIDVPGLQDLFNLNGGVLRGHGMIVGQLRNNGEIRIEDNQWITVIRDYTQAAGGKLSYKRNAVGWGKFKVSGKATLDGTLQFDNAGLPSVAGINVVEAGTLVGQFSSTSTPGYLVGYDLAGVPERVYLIPIV